MRRWSGLYGYYGSIASPGYCPLRHSTTPTAALRHFSLSTATKTRLTPASRARALAERARDASANPVVYVELPGAQHSFDLLTSVRFEAVIDGIEAFASIAAADLSRADRE